MRIAVTCHDGVINKRFGKATAFKLYDVEEGTVTKEYMQECHTDTLDGKAAVLQETGADILICGNICSHCQELVRSAGIEILGCVYGDADTAVTAYLAGSLQYETDPEILQ